jgi:hypothetical protein
MRKWLIAASLVLALAVDPRTQTAPKIAWTFAGTDVTRFELLLNTDWVVDMGLPTPTGDVYEYTLPALPAGMWTALVRACYGSVCTPAASAITIVKMVADGANNHNFHWVDNDGAAAWESCDGDTPISGSAACSLTTANANATAGDTVWMRGGTYTTTPLVPAKSGSAGSRITFRAYPGETPTITWNSGTDRGFSISGKDYISIIGLSFIDCGAWGQLANGADYNEIAYCTFSTSGYVNGNKGIYVWYTSTHNWIHHNTFGRNLVNAGCEDEGGNLWLGVYPPSIGIDNYNVVEHNEFHSGGHHLMETYSKYNIIRQNVFHNEGFYSLGGCTWGPSARNGLYGNRNLQIYDGGNSGGMFNLVEDNRTGHSAFAPGTTEGAEDGNLTITAPKNIVRYNYSYYSETWGIYFKAGTLSYGENNRVYNNTLYNNGVDSQIYPTAWTGYGDLDWRKGIGDQCGVASQCDQNIIKNNIIYGSYTADVADKSGNTYTHNWLTATGNPGLAGTDTSDATSLVNPTLTLGGTSAALNGATYLTQANGAGSSSTTLVVDDALYFQDGTWGNTLSPVRADWIAIGTVDNVVAISSIDYTTNTITLASAMTWADNANIWLYKDSSGRRVLYSTAPDYGAYEYGTPTPAAPTAIVVR